MAQNPNRDINESINEDKSNREVLVKADHVKVYFKGKDKKSGTVKAVDDVSFHIMKGETFGVVGESGCGKSTLGRALVRLLKPTEGHIYMGGTDIAGLKGADLKKMRRKVQIIFQDPSACLNPRRTVRQILMEPFEIHGMKGKMDVEARIMKLLNLVGLDLYCLSRYPHELSGGQKQRISIARVFLKNPAILILDEATSALDNESEYLVSQSLEKLAVGRTTLTIAHRLTTIQGADRILVLAGNKIVEEGNHEQLLEKKGMYYQLYTTANRLNQGIA